MQRKVRFEMASERILVVDDEEELLKLFSRILAREGYGVDFAHDGKEAVDMTDRNHYYSAVIMDLRMPRMSGQEAILKIRKTHPGIKIIVISGYPLDSKLKRRVKRGEIAYFSKPFDNDRVIAKIKKVCKECREVK